MLEVGSLVDNKYKILNEIGHGGMSIVYLAINERANQTWAIKEVRKSGETKDDVVEQGLIAEMNILKKLNHPHLPRIVDIIDYEDSFLIVMDYIEGIDLDKKLREGPQKWDDVVDWGKQLCDILAYLHSRPEKIIYRDMKPGNVKLKPDGDVVLFDFGTARTYKSQRAGDDTTCLGTRGYAAPEQYGGMGQTDTYSDIYCLGATMFHLVTGRLPGGPPDYDIPPIRQICDWLPRTGKDGECVRGLEYIIAKCTQPNPANRYQTCAELMYDLENIDKLSNEYVGGLRSKLKGWIACVASVLVLAVAGGVLSYASTRTMSKNYDETLASALSSVKMNMSEDGDDSSYKDVLGKLKDAIKTDPSRREAWMYLAKLMKSDYRITYGEYNEMKTLLDSNDKAVKSDEAAYSRFCYEWGRDLYFFFDKDGTKKAGQAGDPDKAQPYLRVVVDGDEEELKQRLINTARDNNTSVDSFMIEQVDAVGAEQEFSLASNLYKISKSYSALGNSSAIYGSGNYSANDYWADLQSLMDNVDGVSGSAAGVNDGLVKCSVYVSVMSAVNSRMSEFNRNGVSVEKIKAMVDQVRTKSNALKNDLTQSNPAVYEQLLPLFESINNQCSNAQEQLKSY